MMDSDFEALKGRVEPKHICFVDHVRQKQLKSIGKDEHLPLRLLRLHHHVTGSLLLILLGLLLVKAGLL